MRPFQSAKHTVRAAQCGVRIRMVVEASHARDGKIAYDGLAALGSDVRRMAGIYTWPLEQHPMDQAGQSATIVRGGILSAD